MAELAAVAFDLDGTLFDHYGAARRAVTAWLPTLSGDDSPELVEAWFVAERRHFPAWRDGQVSFAEQRRRRLREILDLLGLPPRSADELDALFDEYLAVYRGEWRAFDDVAAAYDAVTAAGLRTAILTNGPEELQRAKIDGIGLTGRVGPVITAEGLGVAKPYAGAYDGLCAALGMAPHQVMYVGDDYDLDVVGARAAGVRAIHLDRNGAGPEGEHARITTLDELAARIA